MKTVSAFIRSLLIVLLILFCLSLVEDDLLLPSFKNSDVGTMKRRDGIKNTSIWVDRATSMLSDWGVNTSSLATSKSSSWDATNFWLPTNLTSSNFSLSSWTDWSRSRWTGDSKENSKKNSTMTGFSPKVSIVIDSVDDQEDEWLTRLAFAKMLQIEADNMYGVETEIVLLVMTSTLSSCFPNIQNEARVVSNATELRIVQDEQEKWLGEKSRLLDTSPEIWSDSLYLLKEHYQGKDARYDGEISLPFLRIDHIALALSEWKHVDEVLTFVKVKHECCTFTTTNVENETIVHLESKSFVHPHQLMDILPNQSTTQDIVLIEFGTPSSYANVLRESYRVQSFVGSSLAARYCVMVEASNLVGFADSPVDVLAAMANTRAKSIVVVSEDLYGNETTFSSNDRRSRIQRSTLPTLDRNITLLESLRSANNKSANETSGLNGTSASGTLLMENETVETRLSPARMINGSISIVIQLSGEMGNHLGKIAYGYGLSWFLKEVYNISTNVILRHQENPKWVKGRHSLVRCFPNFRESNFEAGNTQEFADQVNHQIAWLGDQRHSVLYNPGCESEDALHAVGRTLVEILSNTSDRPPEIPHNSNVSLPLIFADRFANFCSINDLYYDRLRELFKYDHGNSACCSIRSAPNETVFHARGFIVEMPRVGRRYGFEELSPNKTVTELLTNHPVDKPIAVLGRFEVGAQPYIDKFQEAGFQARFVRTETGEQSFCYLMSSQSEFIGTADSTFAVWAAYLGNSTRARLWSLRCPFRTKRYGLDGAFYRYNFSNPVLRKKISFENYNSEEQDQIEQQQDRIVFRRLGRNHHRTEFL